jgi:hypothetical protein
LDKNNDGVKECQDTGISNVKITLTGTDQYGNTVSETTYTDCNGNYSFTSLVAGVYTITESDPSGYKDGKDTAGSLGGTVNQDVIAKIVVDAGDKGTGYNFAELQSNGCGCR